MKCQITRASKYGIAWRQMGWAPYNSCKRERERERERERDGVTILKWMSIWR
jgi:hypothetical protein